ncbi:MAG: hypothetical protein ACLRNQ_13020 [Flavonifractor plautii]
MQIKSSSLLCLCRILWERTDEDHPLTVPELIQALEAWDIKAERKSIYDDMEALRTLGMDVQSRKGKSPGWFLGERTFQLAELKAAGGRGAVLQVHHPAQEQRAHPQAGVPGVGAPGPPAPAAGVCGPPGEEHE